MGLRALSNAAIQQLPTSRAFARYTCGNTSFSYLFPKATQFKSSFLSHKPRSRLADVTSLVSASQCCRYSVLHPGDFAVGIAGNASQETKKLCLDHFNFIVGARDRDGFAHAVGKRLRLVQIDVTLRPEEPIRKEVRIVCEITVEPDMVNAIGTLHGACSTFIIDDCSSLPIAVMGQELYDRPIHGVSQTITTFYHAPAFLGAKLRIVSTSLTYGSRIMSARCEIWDKGNQRLVSSGMHAKMQPSPPKPTGI